MNIPDRLLLGSGPSSVPERVLSALAQPTIGHLDPVFSELIDEVAARLRIVFGTANAATFPVSGTGSGGMDAMVANLIEPGDRVVCGVNGAFGVRMADALERAGADVVEIKAPWGTAVPNEVLIATAQATSNLAAIFVVHGETSTGVCQPLDGLADCAHEQDALLLIDCVTSLGGHQLQLDQWGVDCAFSGTQKCLNVPPGLSPFTVGDRALARLREREEPVRSWYFDLSLVLGYFLSDGARAYHHTPPINMIYALNEGLAIALEEGMEHRAQRHQRAHQALRAAMSVLGCERLAADGEELWPLLAVNVPDGLDEASIRRTLLRDHGIEISGGLGPLAGKIWRIGVMGDGALLQPQRRLLRELAPLMGQDSEEAIGVLEEKWAAA